ncbi:collagen alpha-1(I) chain-like isoform X1 [Corvus moneduloides]|uniref:collagen alpha-1(I) chain-like isoform X1 n=1 Tax=Corvus moneduloides TaxID=1196302 RepID=UPI001362892A|nr:collagen alpha-1(I) chain-like isoform X1 [Corvus moneduloides]
MGDRCQAPGCPAGLRRKPSTEEGKLRAGRGGRRRPRPQGERAGPEGAAGSAGSPAAAVGDRAGRRVPPSRGVPSPPSRSPPPPSSSVAADASCGPPASRRRRVAGEPRSPGFYQRLTVGLQNASVLHRLDPSPAFFSLVSSQAGGDPFCAILPLA